MENGPFIDYFPINTPFSSGIFHGYVSHNQMVYHFHNSYGCGDFPTSSLQTTPQVGWEQKSSDGHLDGLLRAAGQKIPRRNGAGVSSQVPWVIPQDLNARLIIQKNGDFHGDFVGFTLLSWWNSLE